MRPTTPACPTTSPGTQLRHDYNFYELSGSRIRALETLIHPGVLSCGSGPSGALRGIGEAPQQGRLSSLDKLHYSVTGDLPAEEDCDPLADWAARRSTEREFDRLSHIRDSQLVALTPAKYTHAQWYAGIDSMLTHLTDLTFAYPILGTPLYHGTWHSELPPGPDWTAFDPEHSVVFCGSSIEDGRCLHLTLMTTRPLNIVYFDGTSAAKLSSGTLYSQDIVAWGDARTDWSLDEWRETRVRLDLSGLISFYDTELVSSLVSARFGKERWDHRLLNISIEDAVRVRPRLEKSLSRPADRSSGIDWQALIRVVIDRYSERLQVVQYLLNFTDTNGYDADSVVDDAIKIQVQLRHMLMPYIGLNVVPRLSGANVKGKASDVLDWARPVYKLCATTLPGTTREICRVVTKMWGLGVLAGVDQFIGTDREPNVETTQNAMNTWRKDINELMAWLDWNAWVKCRPECGQRKCVISRPGRRFSPTP
ncbi:hypothetical protein PISMIDRAFT_13898 [Pisolithus microcarpus 441]|uniref:Uncharacterized protein n=1 Tax=Pisolithus microcarpus 441 TaxID=765257 RepID=A0A0C9Z9K2_9AGAM|nr:hypothetical protein PISMIDRAFT_13898 [Pisolithus microcarpus 441]